MGLLHNNEIYVYVETAETNKTINQRAESSGIAAMAMHW